MRLSIGDWIFTTGACESRIIDLEIVVVFPALSIAVNTTEFNPSLRLTVVEKYPSDSR